MKSTYAGPIFLGKVTEHAQNRDHDSYSDVCSLIGSL